MILFFGTRPGKRETQTLTNATCPYCGQQGTLTAISQPNYAHLFWVKLFKISTQRYAECGHCKRAFYENEFTEEMKEAVEKPKRLS